jgi:predicted ATPase
VELADLVEGGQLLQRLAETLGVRLGLALSLSEVIAQFLYDRQVLLVLDNCEHLLPACAGLTQELLMTCTQLQILATSREALGLAGEYVYPVPPFSLPEERLADNLLLKSEAIQLFVERAVAINPTFKLTPDNRPAVIDICRYLDGLPFAIELAATKVKLLSATQIAAYLNDSLKLLVRGYRTTSPRQQSLRGAFDWSYNLLPEPEQRLFRRLSVFVGEFTLESVQSLWAGDPTGESLLVLLDHLVNKSLIMSRLDPTRNQSCYWLLETFRQYASEKLSLSSEAICTCDTFVTAISYNKAIKH